MSLLTVNSLPSERARGLAFREMFASNAKVTENGGVFTATPPTVENGIYTGGLNKAIQYDKGFQFEAEFTVMAWVYWDGTVGIEKIILAKGFGGGLTGLQFQISSVGLPECYSYVSSIYGVRGNANITPNTWTHIAAHRTNAGGWKMFVNGVDVSVPFSSTGAPVKPSERYLTIGGLDTTGGGASSRWWYGKLKQVSAFNKALSIEEIQAYYNNTMWNYMDNAYLVMDGRVRNYDVTNTKILDVSGSGNHLTLTAAGLTKNTKLGYVQNAGATGTSYNSALTQTILAANSGTQSIFYAGKLYGTNYTPLLGNSNWVLGLTNAQTLYLRSFKPDKSYSNRGTTNKVILNKVNYICGVKKNNIVNAYINGVKDALSADDSAYQRDITKAAVGYDMDTYCDVKDVTTTSYFDPYFCAYFNIALNQMQIIDLQLSFNINDRS